MEYTILKLICRGKGNKKTMMLLTKTKDEVRRCSRGICHIATPANYIAYGNGTQRNTGA